MGQLRKKGNHLVVTFGAEHRHVLKAEHLPQLFAQLGCLGGITLGRHHNVVGGAENIGRCVAHAADLAAGHRVGGNKFNALGQQRLHLGNDVTLNAGHVGDDGARLNKAAVLLYPVDKDVRIKGKKYQVGRADKLGVHGGSTAGNDALIQRVVHIPLLGGYGADAVALLCEGRGVAAAHQSQTDDEYIHILT